MDNAKNNTPAYLKFCLLAWLCLVLVLKGYALEFSGANSGVDTDGNNSASLTLAQGALTDGYIVVGVSMYDPVVNASITVVTYGNTPMTLLGTIQDANAFSEVHLFGLAVGNKAAGNYNVVLTGSTGIDELAFGVSAFSGVNQTAPTGPFASAIGSSTSASVEVSSAAGDLVVDILNQDNGVSSAGANQTQNWRQEDSTGRADGVSSRTTATGATTTISYLESVASTWSLGAVALKSSGPPPEDTTPPTITSVVAMNATTVQVVFSEPVVQTLANYGINNGVTVSAAVLGADTRTVTLTTSTLATGVNYILTVNNVTDRAIVPNAILTNSTAAFSFGASLEISEFMAANSSTLADVDGEFSDWIEIHNPGASAVNLAGWSLTDTASNPFRWVFPSKNLAAGGYLVIFASGKDRRAPSSELHTNFKLAVDGGYLALVKPDGTVASGFAPAYPPQHLEASYGLVGNTGTNGFLSSSTPGVANPVTITTFVADTKFSHDRGLFNAPFSLVISCATPGAMIYFTTDGTPPSAANGVPYSAPVPITRTTVVRARAEMPGARPSNVDTHSYLFLGDIITQQTNGSAPPGWPSSWGNNVVDYGMDPNIVTQPPWSGTISNDLQAVPTISVVMRLADLFDAQTGIYANAEGQGIAWERPCSIELIYPDGRSGFQVDAGARIRGGVSRLPNNPKHSFRFLCREQYGDAKLKFKLFGKTGASEFDGFDLRAAQNNGWTVPVYGGPSALFVPDPFSRNTMLAMGQPGERGNFYHLYINGQYWGMYNSCERPEANFAASYFGGAPEDYDVLKPVYELGSEMVPTDGNGSAWSSLWQAAVNGFETNEKYFRVQGRNSDGSLNLNLENLLDVTSLVDYLLVTFWTGNKDGPVYGGIFNDALDQGFLNNYYAIRSRLNTGGFRFLTHDAELTLVDVQDNRIALTTTIGDPASGDGAGKCNPYYLWKRLLVNSEFRQLLADRIQKHFFNNGALTTTAATARFQALADEMDRAIVGESARWGDFPQPSSPLTRNDWIKEVNLKLSNYFPYRSEIVLNQLRSKGLFPSITAPVMSSTGGVVTVGSTVILTHANASGAIYYTVDGSDPRAIGGAINSSAISYSAPIPIATSSQVRARVRSGSNWSPAVEASFYPAQDYSRLLLSELMFNPPASGATPGDELEFLELKNAGTNTIDLGGASFTGITFQFANGTVLAPGQFLVLGRNATALTAKYPGLLVSGIYTGKLDNAGETITLRHPLGATVLSVNYKDSGKWPLTPDGYGFSLVLRNPNASPNPNNPGNWRASTYPEGSPGADDPAPVIPEIVINEALTHTDPPLLDSIELHNPTPSGVSVAGWFLTDDRNVPTKYRIPSSTIIPAGSYLVFSETNFNLAPGASNSFNLDSHGEEVYLVSADAGGNLTGYSHGFSFGAAANGVSFGRHFISTGEERFVAQVSRTLGNANSAPLVGPVVISEVMYHPPDFPGGLDNTTEEYVELSNIMPAPVSLFDPIYPTNTWHIRGGVTFDFPENTVLGALQSLVLVNFAPTNPSAVSAFLSRYGQFNGVPLFGPYGGKLDNSNDTITLLRPDSPETNTVPYLVVDEVGYKDSAPWPAAADGGGTPLSRVSLSTYGDDPVNWGGATQLVIISFEPLNASVRAGSNVSFKVTAAGAGELTYQWRRDDLAITDVTNDVLQISNAQVSHEGAYSVMVSDSFSSYTSPAGRLVVLVDPVIVQPPTNQTVSAGAIVTLSATITGNPPPFLYQWRRLSPGPLSTNVVTSNERTVTYNFTAPITATTQTWQLVVMNQANPFPGVTHAQPAAIMVTAASGDTDGDGIPDVWESAYGLNPTNALDAMLDTDRDGMDNRDEYISGTDPQNSSDFFKIDEILAGSPRLITFRAISNRSYSVQYKNSLSTASWSKLADVVARATNRVESVPDGNGSNQRFYRIVTPQSP